jgi:hypothetical protein
MIMEQKSRLLDVLLAVHEPTDRVSTPTNPIVGIANRLMILLVQETKKQMYVDIHFKMSRPTQHPRVQYVRKPSKWPAVS